MNIKNVKDELLEKIIGMSEKSAVKWIELCYGYSSRIVHRDGTSYVVTMDLRLNRINLYIEDGVVTKYDIG
jgi:hypothetical protein